MAAPLALAGAAARARLGRGLARRIAGAGAGLGLLFVVVLVGVFGALNTMREQGGRYRASELALSDIPRAYLGLYRAAGARYRIDWAVLAAIGSIETDHGRSAAPGVRSGVNAYGCCAGPMQFYVVGRDSTWAAYGADGDGDGRASPYDPADAIPAAARYLRASGAPWDYRRAVYAYNHAGWYVEDVLVKAARYRGAASGGELAIGAANAAAVLRNPRIALTGSQRGDLRRGGIDPRVIATLEAAGREHSLVVTAMQSDHSPGTNHEAGRAIDIGAVDGQICTDTRRTGACGRLYLELARVRGPVRSTELIYCFDGDPRDADVFARSDHCDHIHVGFDAGG